MHALPLLQCGEFARWRRTLHLDLNTSKLLTYNRWEPYATVPRHALRTLVEQVYYLTYYLPNIVYPPFFHGA